jgi:hypothetical protein
MPMHWPATPTPKTACSVIAIPGQSAAVVLGATPQRDSAVMLYSRRGIASRPPKWIKPQLMRLVDEAPTGNDWLHEIKYDGYRMHTRIDGREVLRTNLQSWGRHALVQGRISQRSIQTRDITK